MSDRPIVNAAATLTRLGGSIMAPAAVAAMADAATRFVDLPAEERRVGRRLAERTGNDAAMVTSGATAGLTLAVASCLTGPEPSDLEVFPLSADAPGVVMLRAQRNAYDYAARVTGARIIEAGSDPASLRSAIRSGASSVLWFAGTQYADDALGLEAVVDVARAEEVPVLVDAAAQIPPVSSLWDFTVGAGAAAAIFSGGKGLKGPQSTGLVVGRRAIIDGCRAHASPAHGIGRSMKVGKEELAALAAAVEAALDGDEPALLARYESIVDGWLDGLRGHPGVRTERSFPSEAGQPHSRALIRLDPSTGWTAASLEAALWDGHPRVAVQSVADDAIALNPQTLQPGDEQTVLAAVHAALSGRDSFAEHPHHQS